MARKKKVEAQRATTVSNSAWGTWGTWVTDKGVTKVQVKPRVQYEVISLTDAEIVIKHDVTGKPITVERSLMTVV